MAIVRDSLRRPVIDQEQALVDLAHRLGEGWFAVHIHLSRISKARRNENLVFALQLFEKLVREYDGHFLIMKNGDWVFIYRDIRSAPVRKAVDKLRQLFAGDGGYFHEEQDELGFASWYSLDRQRDEFVRLSEMLLAEKIGGSALPPADAASASSDVKLRGRASDLVSLGRIVDGIERMDVEPAVRSQPVCAVLEAGPPRLLFEETYFSIEELERLLNRGPLMTDDLWCFQFMTRALDRKLLGMMQRSCQSGEAPNLSINVNVASVLGLEFADFDAAIPEPSKRTLAIEFQFVDLFGDVGAYLYARDLLHERGYHVFLDGLTDIQLPFVDRERLGVDMLKLRWSPSLMDGGAEKGVANALERIGGDRVILCRCDSREAVEFGQALGIGTFQGRYITSLLTFGAGEPSFLAAL